MKPLTWLLASVLLYSVSMVALMPASVFNVFIKQYVGSEFQISQTRGTVWRGSGNVPGMGMAHWQVHVWALLLGRVHVTLMQDALHVTPVHAGSVSPPTDIWLSPSSVHVEHMALMLPIELLSRRIASLKKMHLGGQFSISADQLILGSAITGRMVVYWLNATTALSPIGPVGTYKLLLMGQGDHVQLQLTTLNGPLVMSGNGRWSRHSGLQFSGIGQSAQEQLAALLNLIGQPIGNNTYSIRVFAS